MKRIVGLACGLTLVALAGCDTEPATNVSYTDADVTVRVGCLDTQGSNGGAYDAEWRVAYRKVGADSFQTAAWHNYHCDDEQAPHYITGSPFVEHLSNLDPGTGYEYRAEFQHVSGASFEWRDTDGTQNGTNYDSFTTQQVPTSTPVAAKTFRDSEGINSRIVYSGTPYANLTEVGNAVDYTGIRHLRESYRSWRVDDFINLAQQHNLTYTLDLGEMDPDNDNVCGPFDMQAIWFDWHAHTALYDRIKYIEGLNEIDNPSAEGERIPGWVDCAKQYMAQRWQLVGGERSIVGPTLICTAYTNWDPNRCPQGSSFDLLGNIEQWVDYGNMHPYAGGEAPDRTGTCGSQPCNSVDFNTPFARQLTPNRPLFATETGYHTWVCTPDPNTCNQGQPPVSEAVQAPYVLRTYLDYFRKGLPHTDIFSIVDANDCNALYKWGLYRCDWSHKPAADAVHNFNFTINNGTPALSPLRILVEQGPADLRRLVFRRADGSYIVALWRTASIWNTSTRQAITVNPTSVKLVLPDATNVTYVRPVDSPTENNLPITNRRVSIGVAGAPVLLRVTTP
jgi:hypothetical protein